MKKQLNTAAYLTFALCSFNVQANLISNPGFESGLTDWQSSGDATIRVQDPLAYEGTNYVFGQSSVTVPLGTERFKVWQDIDLLGSGFTSTQIDTGNLDIVFGGWQSGWNAMDYGQISVRLLDASMVEIFGGLTSLAAFTSDHSWVEQSGITDLLVDTRFVRYEFTGTINFGKNTDAYLDAAYLKVVPVPAAVWLFGSGLIGLIALARRKAQA